MASTGLLRRLVSMSGCLMPWMDLTLLALTTLTTSSLTSASTIPSSSTASSASSASVVCDGGYLTILRECWMESLVQDWRSWKTDGS